MKTILCFGDSNTWGAGIYTGTLPRHSYEHRWTTILENTLNQNGADDPYRVVVNGVNGRTIASTDTTRGDVINGLQALPTIISAHYPIDTLVIMLGTNDVTDQFELSARQVASHMMQLIISAMHWHTVQNPTFDTLGKMPQIILVCPAYIQNTSIPCITDQTNMQEKSRALQRLYKSLAKNMGIDFVDANAVVTVTPEDGVHWDTKSHQKFGSYLATFIK